MIILNLNGRDEHILSKIKSWEWVILILKATVGQDEVPCPFIEHLSVFL